MRRHLPTALTLTRIALAPLCAGLLLVADAVIFQHGRAIAALLSGFGTGLFLFAALTDALDGWLARRWAVTSTLGASLDHAADKALCVCGALALAATWAPLDVVLVLLMILARDAVIGGLREGLAGSGRAFGVGRLGKLKTVCLLGGLTSLMALQACSYGGAPLVILQGLLLLGRGLLYLALAAALFSARSYVSTVLNKNNA